MFEDNFCGARPASKVWRASGQDPVYICVYFVHVMLASGG